VFSWIPAFARTTCYVVINDVVYDLMIILISKHCLDLDQIHQENRVRTSCSYYPLMIYFPQFPISLSPHLPISLSPHLPISLSEVVIQHIQSPMFYHMHPGKFHHLSNLCFVFAVVALSLTFFAHGLGIVGTFQSHG
jgi:hypothetical protein